jgi:hypothetical protein
VSTAGFRAGSINSSPDNVVVNPDLQLLRFPTTCPGGSIQLGSLKINAVTITPTTLLTIETLNGLTDLAEYIQDLALVIPQLFSFSYP